MINNAIVNTAMFTGNVHSIVGITYELNVIFDKEEVALGNVLML